MATSKQTRKYPRFAQTFDGDGQTQAHFKDSCDINNIVETYARTGIDPNPDGQTNQKFGFATSKDFTESAFNMAEITSAFAELPSAVRSQYSNDPALWLDANTRPEPTEEPNAPPEGSPEPLEPPDSTPPNSET